MSKNMNVKKASTKRWWMVILGSILGIVGLIFGVLYTSNNMNYGLAMLAVITLGPAIYLLYAGLRTGESGFVMQQSRVKVTGEENALIWCAKRTGDKDIPTYLAFLKISLNKIPTGARLKYLRNIKRHVYELIYDTSERKLKPVTLPDKKNFSPELFKIPATMQPVKDYLEYSPPTMLQKMAPWVIMVAMIIVGILMVMTNSE